MCLLKLVRKMIKRILLTVLILSFFIAPISAADIRYFTTDYDNSIYSIESITIDVPDEVPNNWYPLREVSSVLDFQLEWNSSKKIIAIYYKVIDEMWNVSIYTLQDVYKSDDLVILNGVTYCSPRFLNVLINGLGFVYEDTIYYYSGESVKSKLIRDQGHENFRKYVNTSMYELYLKHPECYEYVRIYLDGGIEKSTKVREGKWSNVAGYTYPLLDEGICFILENMNGAKLTSIIVHEATHVYQARNGLVMTEDLPHEYQYAIYSNLIKSNNILN